MFGDLPCTEFFAGLVAWSWASLVVFVIVLIITLILPDPLAGAIRSAASTGLGVATLVIAADTFATVFGFSDNRCKRAGFWTPWPPLRGKRYDVDADGRRIDRPSVPIEQPVGA
jgi:hypothetical protein